MATPTKAVEGRRFFTTQGVNSKVELVVGPACADKHNGHWYCITHGEGFMNQMMKDGHLETRGKHELVWICHTHGPEVP